MDDLARWLEPDVDGKLNRFVWLRDEKETGLANLQALAGWPYLSELILESHDQLESCPWPDFSELQTLTLRNCRLQALPAGFNGKSLKVIDLSINDLESIEPLADAPDLVELHLAHNPIARLPETATWPQLQILNLTGTPSRLKLTPLAQIEGLRILYVKQRVLPQDTRALTQVEQLFASLEGERPLIDFSTWKGLQLLHLHIKNKTDLSSLKMPSTLKELTLTQGPHLKTLPSLDGLVNLERLNLHYIGQIDAKALEQAPALRQLSIKGAAISVQELRRCFPNLKILG